jgi:hypothetical protein
MTANTAADPAAANSDVRSQLLDTACQFCESGTLVDGTYKDSYAVVCDHCVVPAYRPI